MVLRGHIKISNGSHTPHLESECGTIAMTVYPTNVGSRSRAISGKYGFKTENNAKRAAEQRMKKLTFMVNGVHDSVDIIWNPF